MEIKLTDIRQDYPHPTNPDEIVTVVQDLNLTYSKPGIYPLLGPSGCGKSTVQRLMGGVRPFNTVAPTSGTVLIDGKPCTGAHPEAVTVFQGYNNLPHLTVQGNMELPFKLKRWRGEKDIQERIQWILGRVGLADKAGNLPKQLSGGQQQRLALARALILRPKILLMDEPFGALDAQTRHEMQSLLISLWEEQRCTIVFITHDIEEALLIGDRVTVLSTKPAKVAEEFILPHPKPRTEDWLQTRSIRGIENRILGLLQG